MKKTGKFFMFIALISALLLGCAGVPSWHNPVNIKIDGKMATVAAGGTLNFRASGQYIMWDVSSSGGGFQPAAEGTFISPHGLLTVALDEPALFLYVTARSAKTGRSATKQIKVVTVDAVNIIPARLSVEVGRSSQFVARVSGNNYPDHAVIWRVSSNADGTGAVAYGTYINEYGLLRVSSNERASVLYVFAISMLNLRVYSCVIINVNPVYVVYYAPPPAYFFPNAPHPPPPVNNPYNNPHSKPQGDNPPDRPHSNPQGDKPIDRPRSNPPTDNPPNRPHSNPQVNNPNNNPRPNPPADRPRNRYRDPLEDPPEDTPPRNPRSSPSADTPRNNPRSNPPETTPSARERRR